MPSRSKVLPEPIVYSIAQAAAYINMSETYVRRAIYSGRLEAAQLDKPNGPYRIFRADLDRWLRERITFPKAERDALIEKNQAKWARLKRKHGKPQRLTW